MDGGLDFYDWIFAALFLAGSVGASPLALLSRNSPPPALSRLEEKSQFFFEPRKTMHVDVLVGLIIGGGVFLFMGEPSLSLAVFGALAALAPDADFLVWLARHHWKTNQFVHEHRDLFHHPLLFSVMGGLAIRLCSPALGLTWFLATLWHFAHDTFDGGWGIRWGSPFRDEYLMLGEDGVFRIFKHKAEQRAWAAQHGNPN